MFGALGFSSASSVGEMDFVSAEEIIASVRPRVRKHPSAQQGDEPPVVDIYAPDRTGSGSGLSADEILNGFEMDDCWTASPMGMMGAGVLVGAWGTASGVGAGLVGWTLLAWGGVAVLSGVLLALLLVLLIECVTGDGSSSDSIEDALSR